METSPVKGDQKIADLDHLHRLILQRLARLQVTACVATNGDDETRPEVPLVPMQARLKIFIVLCTRSAKTDGEIGPQEVHDLLVEPENLRPPM